MSKVEKNVVDIEKWKAYREMSQVCGRCYEGFGHYETNIAKVTIGLKETYICERCADKMIEEGAKDIDRAIDFTKNIDWEEKLIQLLILNTKRDKLRWGKAANRYYTNFEILTQNIYVYYDKNYKNKIIVYIDGRQETITIPKEYMEQFSNITGRFLKKHTLEELINRWYENDFCG